jgi:hypothetical protein
MLDHERSTRRSCPRHHCSRPGDLNKGRHWQVKDEQMEQGMKSRQVTAMTQTQQVASVSVDANTIHHASRTLVPVTDHVDHMSNSTLDSEKSVIPRV